MCGLYFRPQDTNPSFSNEGFRPRGQWSLNSHCPGTHLFIVRLSNRYCQGLTASLPMETLRRRVLSLAAI